MKTIDELKRQVWELKAATGLTHAQALDAIAQREGFKNWMRLLDSRKVVPQ